MANLYSNEILETNNYYVSSNYKNSDNLLSITTEQTEGIKVFNFIFIYFK